MSAIIHTADGAQVDLAGALKPELFAQIQESGLTPQAHLNRLANTGVNQPSVVAQLADQMGFHRTHNRQFGIRPGTLKAILEPVSVEAGAITRDADLGPRVFFPIYALSVMEEALRADNSPILGAYNRMISVRETIPSDKFERPLIDYTEAEKPRGAHVAQLSEPRVMVQATVSSKIYRIPSEGIGIEYSDQAAAALGLDFLMNGFARRAEQAAIDRVFDHVLGFINGDSDIEMLSLAASAASSNKAKATVDTATVFDATIANTAGLLTQEAWVKWLFQNSRKRTINYVLTDMAGALSIQNRVGRPNVMGDNSTSKRIDTMENIVNPMWPDKVDIFLVDDPRWPANTIVGMDTRYGVHHVDSTALNYQGAEQWAIRRSTKLRFDLGEVAMRLYDDAWSVLVLA